MDSRIAFGLGVFTGASLVAKMALKQHQEFCKFDERKNLLVESMFEKLQDHAPQEVIEQMQTEASFFNITAREGL